MASAELFETICKKATLNTKVNEKTSEAFKLLRTTTQEIIKELESQAVGTDCKMNFKFKNNSDFEFEISFAGDVLVFVMHTNVFEFSRDHEVMKTSYIKEEKNRSYCGIISIYNFLADSFAYNRDNDLGYLIGRIFINAENHYFIEGKKEIGLLYNNFNSTEINAESVRNIIESAMMYTINFDLLTPPFDSVKMVSVSDFKLALGDLKITTGKRLGFRFQADTE